MICRFAKMMKGNATLLKLMSVVKICAAIEFFSFAFSRLVSVFSV